MAYWIEFVRTWGKETYRTWRWELFASALVSCAVLGKAIVEHSPTAWSEFRTAVYANGIVLGAFTLWHLVRTPYLLHKEAEERHAKEVTLALEQGKIAQKELIGSIPTQQEWLDLADRFKTIPYTTGDWFTSRQNTNWTVHDNAVRSLCTLAGSMLIKSPGLLEKTYPSLLSQPDHLLRWLEYIKATKPSTHNLRGEEELPDGTKLFSHMGVVEVPKNSADICIEFAAHSGGRV